MFSLALKRQLPFTYITSLTLVLSSCPQVKNLSGGELQRVAITLALGKPADIYLIDEPSAYLDSEQRLIAAKVRLECCA